MNKTSRQGVYNTLCDYGSEMTAEMIAARLDASRSAVAAHLKKLVGERLARIERVGEWGEYWYSGVPGGAPTYKPRAVPPAPVARLEEVADCYARHGPGRVYRDVGAQKSAVSRNF